MAGPAGAGQPVPLRVPDTHFEAVLAGAAYGVLAVLGFVLAVVGSFHAGWTMSGLPIVAIIATTANFVVFWGAGWAMRSKLGSLLPAVTWLIVVLLLSVRRVEGDLIVTGSMAGQLFLVGGSIAAAVAVGLAPAARLEALAAAARTGTPPTQR